MLLLVTESLQSPALRVKREGEDGDNTDGGDTSGGNKDSSSGGNQIPIFTGGSGNAWQTVVDSFMQMVNSNSNPVSGFVGGK